MPALTVIRPGMLTTIQDLGRWGHQHIGVPVAGPMDWYTHRQANALAGNPEQAAALEITLIGPELEATGGDLTCVVGGARFDLTIDGKPVERQPFVLPAGSRLRFGERTAGARAVLAVSGGLDVPEVLGSRSTSLISGMGPFGGRAVRAADVLPVGSVAHERAGDIAPLPLPLGGARVRVIAGPHERMFTPAAVETLTSARFIVSPESNRMGYRLAGPTIEHDDPTEMLSAATPIGSIQVPPSGQPILLMADRQTTGGYPRIATVITADLPLAGQLAPGDWIEFSSCRIEDARDALQAQMSRLGEHRW